MNKESMIGCSDYGNNVCYSDVCVRERSVIKSLYSRVDSLKRLDFLWNFTELQAFAVKKNHS